MGFRTMGQSFTLDLTTCELEVNDLEELKPPDGSPIGSHDHTLSSCSSEL